MTPTNLTGFSASLFRKHYGHPKNEIVNRNWILKSELSCFPIFVGLFLFFKDHVATYLC